MCALPKYAAARRPGDRSREVLFTNPDKVFFRAPATPIDLVNYYRRRRRPCRVDGRPMAMKRFVNG